MSYWEKNGWSISYEKAIREDGSLLFPERLSRRFLDNARRTQGAYIFANQYQNEVIPEEDKRFKPHWIKYYDSIPENTYRFGFIDPAIGQEKHHDYTGIVVVDVDESGHWYVRLALRERLTPTQIISKMFDLHHHYKLQSLGVEIVAYQEALLYFLDQEMKAKKRVIPVTGVKRTSTSKATRILGLVPRFEWGRISFAKGLRDLEDEYASFPRGNHDDLLDALSSLEELIYYPQKPKKSQDEAPPMNSPDYESYYIRQLHKKANASSD